MCMVFILERPLADQLAQTMPLCDSFNSEVAIFLSRTIFEPDAQWVSSLTGLFFQSNTLSNYFFK
jgi:hypothetical protein